MHQIAIYKIKGIRHVHCCLFDKVLCVPCARLAAAVAQAALHYPVLGSEAALVKDPFLLPLFLVCLDDQVVIINAI